MKIEPLLNASAEGTSCQKYVKVQSTSLPIGIPECTSGVFIKQRVRIAPTVPKAGQRIMPRRQSAFENPVITLGAKNVSIIVSLQQQVYCRCDNMFI